jgi:hypothetical protein
MPVTPGVPTILSKMQQPSLGAHRIASPFEVDPCPTIPPQNYASVVSQKSVTSLNFNPIGQGPTTAFPHLFCCNDGSMSAPRGT